MSRIQQPLHPKHAAFLVRSHVIMTIDSEFEKVAQECVTSKTGTPEAAPQCVVTLCRHYVRTSLHVVVTDGVSRKPEQ
jgi:hypothetical protein